MHAVKGVSAGRGEGRQVRTAPAHGLLSSPWPASWLTVHRLDRPPAATTAEDRRARRGRRMQSYHCFPAGGGGGRHLGTSLAASAAPCPLPLSPLPPVLCPLPPHPTPPSLCPRPLPSAPAPCSSHPLPLASSAHPPGELIARVKPQMPGHHPPRPGLTPKLGTSPQLPLTASQDGPAPR